MNDGRPAPRRLFVLSSPSGTGKSTIVRRLVERRGDVTHSVSATTRAPRAGESHGVHYLFLTRDEFERRVRREEFLEWAEYGGHLYGTPISEVERILQAGSHVLLDLEVQGTSKLRRRRDDVVTIFILPPSAEELLERLGGRNSDRPEEVARRLRQAVIELGELGRYDYVVENHDLDQAVDEVEAIIDTSGEVTRPPVDAGRVRELSEGIGKLAQTLDTNIQGS